MLQRVERSKRDKNRKTIPDEVYTSELEIYQTNSLRHIFEWIATHTPQQIISAHEFNWPEETPTKNMP